MYSKFGDWWRSEGEEENRPPSEPDKPLMMKSSGVKKSVETVKARNGQYDRRKMVTRVVSDDDSVEGRRARVDKV
jgi:hypothetical protein